MLCCSALVLCLARSRSCSFYGPIARTIGISRTFHFSLNCMLIIETTYELVQQAYCLSLVFFATSSPVVDKMLNPCKRMLQPAVVTGLVTKYFGGFESSG